MAERGVGFGMKLQAAAPNQILRLRTIFQQVIAYLYRSFRVFNTSTKFELKPFKLVPYYGRMAGHG